MKVAVVGGGVGGLAAARALVRAGIDAHVLEASDRAGGVVGTSSVDGYVREHAASSFLAGPPRGALALCEDLAVPVEKASSQAKRRWIFLDGKLRELPRGPLGLVTSDLLTWRGKWALVKEPLAPARKKGEDESVYDFAARRFGAEAARAIVAPFVTGVFAADAHDVSLEAGFPKLAAFDAEGGIVRGAAKQLVGAFGARLRGGAAKAAKPKRGLWAPVGGLGALVDGLAQELGPRVRTGVRVREIAKRGQGVVIDGQAWDGAVLALPARDAVPLVERGLPELATKLAPFERAAVAVVYLGFSARAVPKGLDAFGFLAALGEDLRVLGVVFESTVWSSRAPEGHVLLRCIFGGSRDAEAAGMSDAELVDAARRDVDIALSIEGEPTHASVIRWSHGLAQYRVGHRDRVREAMAVARAQRIALAGADYRGPGINDLTTDAAVIVEEVRAW